MLFRSQVVLVNHPRPVIGRLRDDQHDRRGCMGDVPGSLPDGRKLGQLLAVGDEDEVPVLQVRGRRRPPPGFRDPGQMLR